MSRPMTVSGEGGGVRWTGTCEPQEVGGETEWVYDMGAVGYAGGPLVRITLDDGATVRAVVWLEDESHAYAYAYD